MSHLSFLYIILSLMMSLESAKQFSQKATNHNTGFVITGNHSWFVHTLRTKKPKAHFYFPEINYKVTIHNTHISVMVKFSVLRIKM